MVPFLTEKGSESEFHIIKILRSWLEINFEEQVSDNGATEVSHISVKERLKISQIIKIVNLLQENFEYNPEVFSPEYHCQDGHGGYHCSVIK